MERVQPFVSLIEFYFEIGLKYKDIKSVLDVKYGFQISERHLKRVLNQRGLFRRKTFNDLAVLVDFIRNQLQHSGQLHGYRWMYSKCREYGLLVRKEDVRLVLKELDPRGVSLRQARRLRRRNYFSKGPNFIWHMDSYDKLKPFGICINGAIDGFSRKIMWLNAYITSSDPKLITILTLCTVWGVVLESFELILGLKMVTLKAFSVSSCQYRQAALLTVTWMEPAPPIKELNIGDGFFAASAWSSGYPSSQTSETMASLMVDFWTKTSYNFVAWDLFRMSWIHGPSLDQPSHQALKEHECPQWSAQRDVYVT
ncbi:uncharacterized protein LOC127613013 [Hippocampus zosterae]|uniref:uncharacterized protein LOC127613013 n=1 Tax=Hippocampus zosterae TaxID=109293 RepID=UPI00223E466D|nr:uncharacterized protein LOC127613013 [Hippocampus zosterae]